MKVLIIGGVAAGTKTAAKLKRADRSADVTIITKDMEISYAGCGLPYYVGGAVESRDELIVNTPAKFSALTGVNVITGCEATALDAKNKKVHVKYTADAAEDDMDYDKLVIATGASAVVPPINGIGTNGVFTMRTPSDAVMIREYIENEQAKKAVVIGGGYIGLEIADNLTAQGISVTVIDLAPQLLPNIFDRDMADYIKKQLIKKGIRVICGVKASDILGGGKVDGVKTDAGIFACDLVICSAGIKPNTAFLADTGIELIKDAIAVSDKLETNLPDVYAAGDCVIVTNRITGTRQWSPMGSSANLEGRTLAQIIAGADGKSYKGVLGTGIVKLPELNCGRSGLTEEQAKNAGYDVVSATAVTDDKPHYYPGAAFFIIKLIADRKTRRLLGVQCIGPGEVDKIVDIAVMAMTMNASLDDFDNADFAYAPPFSTAIHPFVQAVYILLNKLTGDMVSMTPAEYAAGNANGYRVIDAAPSPSIHGATHIDYTKVSGIIDGIGTDEKLLLVCAKGKRAYLTQNKLRYYGYTNTVVLEGSTFVNDVRVRTSAGVTEEEKTKVKALGFLFDKTSTDKFNGRVITRNGKITSEESKVISEAAAIYGSGEIAMTTRLTIEIQGVPYDNIEPLREYLAAAGLSTGGTGSKVRPVVSCKGTTCQYGLIDTFGLSEEIHNRFFVGYNNVKLPHKFKIAVGGCPNNCVKPDLNDLGIIGQRVPQIDYSKCRGCKVCQIEKGCPIKVAKVVDGKIIVDPEQCNHCGRCIGRCPFKCFENYTNGYRVYIGGRWGKRVAQGRYLDKVFTDRAEVLDIVEKAILLFREQGITGERFADTVARIGFEKVQEQLLSDDLLARKNENITAQKHLKGGATC
ncbi:MAG: FAD-dependent oxidoreductase [Eubacteriales bacterium]